MTEHAKSEDKRKTKERLIHQLQSLRQKVADTNLLLAELIRNYKEAPIGLCVINLNLRFMHINPCLAAINGVSVEETEQMASACAVLVRLRALGAEAEQERRSGRRAGETLHADEAGHGFR